MYRYACIHVCINIHITYTYICNLSLNKSILRKVILLRQIIHLVIYSIDR